MKDDFPEVQTARLMPIELTVGRGDFEAREQTGWADPNFFRLLPLPVLGGDITAALTRPDAIVVTRRIARKYFGIDLPIGEFLEFSRKHKLQIAAVIEDLPAATHLTTEIIGSALNQDLGLRRYDDVPWPGNGDTPVVTYVSVPSRKAVAELQSAMPDFIQRHMSRLLKMVPQYQIDIRLVRLADLHLYPNDMQAMKPHGKPGVIAAAGVTGVLIALVALVNFVNLMTARATHRAVEVGVRKVSSAHRRQLITQFMGESLLYAIAALALAMALVTIVVPTIDRNLASGIAEQWPIVSNVLLSLGFAFVTGIVGGVYPAFVLSSFRPAAVLKGRAKAMSLATTRYILVLLQFSVLITLLLGVMVINRQIAFSLRDGLSFPQDQMLIVYTHCPDAFTEELGKLPGVADVACAGGDPTNFAPRSYTQSFQADGTPVSLGIGGVGFGFFELLGVKPVAGRLYEPGRDGAAAASYQAPLAILNEAAVRAMGYESPDRAIGQDMRSIENRSGPPSEVIGVVPDFTFNVQNVIPPIVYWIRNVYKNDSSVVYVKVRGSDLPDTLDAIDGLWKQRGGPRPIRRLFIDQHLQEKFSVFIRQGTLMAALSLTAVIIAALGLFGVASFTAEQRTKEIGIRKSMGATHADILRLLLWQFTKPVLWANVIAWPVAYFTMQHWLEGFAYHIELSFWMFLAASTFSLVIAVLTVGGHAWLIARTQPVKALRYE